MPNRLLKLRRRLLDVVKRPHRVIIELLVIWGAPRFIDKLINCLPGSVRHPLRTRTMGTLIKLGFKRELVPADELRQKYCAAIKLLQEQLPDAPLGDYLEFGVYQGTSLLCFYEAAQLCGIDDMRLFGFDSFEGLPLHARMDDGGIWFPGQFKSSYDYTTAYLSSKGVDRERVFLVKGWFQDTLTEDFIVDYDVQRVSIIMIDCDMYSSAKEALEFCIPLIQDQAIIFFDDWFSSRLDERNMGEKRAFAEILEKYPHIFAQPLDEFIYYKDAKVFLVTAGNRDHERAHSHDYARISVL